MDENIDIILSRYFSGEASEEELRQLDCWLAESSENEAYFEEMTAIFQHSAQVTPAPQPDMEKAFAAFQNHMEQGEKQPRHFKTRKLIPYFSVAASIILLIGIFIYLSPESENNIRLTAGNSPIEQTLHDGIHVLLEKNTEITYNEKNIQEINLIKGTATFRVNSEKSGKLIVQVGETYIEDIGTVFSIIAHNPEESITVEVSEGEVHFYTQNDPGINIEQAEKGIYHPKEKYFEHIASFKNIKAIEFSATPLSEVMEILSSQYDATITTNSDSIKQLQISVSFDPNETIEDILAIISETLSIHVTRASDGTYLLFD